MRAICPRGRVLERLCQGSKLRFSQAFNWPGESISPCRGLLIVATLTYGDFAFVPGDICGFDLQRVDESLPKEIRRRG